MSAREEALFTSLVERSRSYLEYGGGGSTHRAAVAGVPIITTIENNRAWIDQLRIQPAIHNAISEDRLNIVYVNLGETAEWGFLKDTKEFRSWPQYFLAGIVEPKEDPDLVLVDGRFRLSCCLTCFTYFDHDYRLLIHDFNDEDWRSHYKRALSYFDLESQVEALVVLRPKRNLPKRAVIADLMKYWSYSS